jgi:hypothetical protein
MSNFYDVVQMAVNTVGGASSDYRVQAGVVALLVITGGISVAVKKIHNKIKAKKDKQVTK